MCSQYFRKKAQTWYHKSHWWIKIATHDTFSCILGFLITFYMSSCHQNLSDVRIILTRILSEHIYTGLSRNTGVSPCALYNQKYTGSKDDTFDKKRTPSALFLVLQQAKIKTQRFFYWNFNQRKARRWWVFLEIIVKPISPRLNLLKR